MKNIAFRKTFTLFVFVILTFILKSGSCNSPSDNSTVSDYRFIINYNYVKPIDLENGFDVILNSLNDTTFKISLADFFYSPVKLLDSTHWIISNLNSPNNFLDLNFEKQQLNKFEDIATLKIHIKQPIQNGTFTYKIEAKNNSFNDYKNFKLNIKVNLSLSNLKATFQPDSLIVAPGDSSSILMNLEGIGQNDLINMNLGVSHSLYKDLLKANKTQFDINNKSIRFSMAVPESRTPENFGVGVDLKSQLTGLSFDYEKNGFLVVIAGYKYRNSDKNSYTTKVGDTLTIEANYNVFGSAEFKPKLIPPTATPPINVDILQDIVSIKNKEDVTVKYKLIFKEKPAATNLNFTAGGDIGYGKPVTGKILIQVK